MLSPETTIDRERVELESKVLAAAMRQSVDLGDAQGANFAHKALFYLLRSHQESAAYKLMARPVFEPVTRQNGEGDHGNGHAHTVEAKRSGGPTTELSDDYLPNLAKLFSDDSDPSAQTEPVMPWQRPSVPETSQNKAKPRQAKPAPPQQALPNPSLPQSLPPGQPPSVAPAPVAPPPPAPVKVEREYVITAEMEKFLETVAQAKDVYALLGVSQYSSYELIHKSFLKRLRKLLLVRSKGGYQRRVLELLRSIWIAHDILIDPNTRNDYDFRVLGLRGQADSQITGMPEDRRGNPDANQAPLKIGELMQASGLLEPTELEIACDMHKAMPEMQFGRFLVKQSFIEEYQLQAVLLGQRLIRDGKLTVSQFQELMVSVKDSVQDFKAAALEKNFVTKTDIAKAEEEEEEAVATKILASLPPKTTARNIAAFSLPTIGKLDSENDLPPLSVPHETPAEVELEPSETIKADSQTIQPEASEKPQSVPEAVVDQSVENSVEPLPLESGAANSSVPSSVETTTGPVDESKSTVEEDQPLSTKAESEVKTEVASVKVDPQTESKKVLSHSRQKSEIKITNARLLSLLEEHERNANSPSDHDQGIFSSDNQLLSEIDLIDESEIEPDLSRSNPSPNDQNKKRKKK
jgi:hypothetical protein